MYGAYVVRFCKFRSRPCANIDTVTADKRQPKYVHRWALHRPRANLKWYLTRVKDATVGAHFLVVADIDIVDIREDGIS